MSWKPELAMVLFWAGVLLLPALLLYAAPLAGIVLIWAIVRRVNHRDDPRHAKPPADTP